VKTLSDAAAASIDTKLTSVTVLGLTTLPAPEHVGDKLPRQAEFGGAEFKTYRLSVRLVGWKLSDNDSDIHVEVRGLFAPQTMVVEFPLAGCVAKSASAYAGVLRIERQLADADLTYIDVKTANARRKLPLYPLLRRVLAAHKLAAVWTDDADPVFAAGRRTPKGYRNVRRALAVAVEAALGSRSRPTSGCRRTRCATRTRRT